MADDRITGLFQEDLLTLLCFDYEHAKFIRNVVDVELFEGLYREVASTLYYFIDTHEDVPGDGLATVFDEILEGKDSRKAKLFEGILQNLFDHIDDVNGKHSIHKLMGFIHKQKMKGGIIEAAAVLQSDVEDAVDEACNIMTQAMKKEEDVFYPGLMLSDTNRALEFLDFGIGSEFSTGIPELDMSGLGPNRKELWLYIAPAKTGKCILEGSLVTLDTGERKPIEQICKEGYSKVISINDQNGKYVVTNVIEHYENGKKPCYEVTTRSGRKITVTGEHPFLTADGWKNVKDIPIGGSVAVPRKFGYWGTEVLEKEKIRYLAYMLADGCLVKKRCHSFTKNDPDLREDFIHCVRTIGSDITWADHQTCYIVNNKDFKAKHGHNPCLEFILDLGLGGKKSIEKHIPEFVFGLTKKLTSEFLRVLFSCDGSVYPNTIEYCSSSEDFIRGVSTLLTKFGLVHKLRKTKLSYVVTISDKKNLKEFKKLIGFHCSRKKNKFDVILKSIENKIERSFIDCVPNDVVKVVYEFVRNEKLHSEDRETLQQNSKRGRGISKTRSDLIIKRNPDVDFNIYFSDNILWDPIVSRTFVGEKQTYDLTVDEHHNFIANDVIVHNTWMLINLAKRALMQKKKVCHITLEMSEERMAMRYFQNMLAITKRQTDAITRWEFERQDPNDRFSEIVDITPHDIRKEFQNDRKTKNKKKKKILLSFDLPNIRKLLLEKINKRGEGLHDIFSRLCIRQFPTGSLTVNGLKAYLDSLENVHKFRPDLLIIDYPDIMTIPGNDHRLGLGELFKDIRGIAVERDMAVASVTQSSKEGAKAKVVRSTHAAEDWSKIATADTIITYSQTTMEARMNLARLLVANARNDRDGFMILISQEYALGQFVMDSAPMYEDYWSVVEGDNEEDGDDD